MESQTGSRPDIDIEEDINALIRTYSPIKAARGFFTFHAHHGHVTVAGNVGSPQARLFLIQNVQKVPGVKSCDDAELFDDEQIRINAASLLPTGVVVNVQFGTVLLVGELPDNNQDIVRKVKGVPGVRKVVLSYRGVAIQ